MVMQFEMPRTMDNFLEDIAGGQDWNGTGRSPAMNVAEFEDKVVVVAEMPGVKKEDLAIRFEDQTLTISGQRRPYQISEDARVLLNEMRPREFQRSVRFTREVDTEKISAELVDGLLTVTVPKAEQARVRTIAIQ